MQHSQIPKCSRQRLAFRRQCGRCLVLLTAEGANRSQAWLACKYHCEPGSSAAASSWECQAYAAVQRVALHDVVATESKVLGKDYGPTDLLFPVQLSSGSVCWVAVEVDGEGHFRKPWRGATQLVRQQQDAEKDAAAWHSRLPVVRLHHGDTAFWPLALAVARWLVQQQCLFTLYTPSYENCGCITCAQPIDASTPIELTWGKVRTWYRLARFQPLVSDSQ